MAKLSRTEGANITAPVEYYAYVIGDDGHIRNRVEIICDDDEEAKRCAKRLLDRYDVELWQLDRRIATFRYKEKGPLGGS